MLQRRQHMQTLATQAMIVRAARRASRRAAGAARTYDVALVPPRIGGLAPACGAQCYWPSSSSSEEYWLSPGASILNEPML